MFGALDISTSALVANRVRLDAISANLANADVPVDPNRPSCQASGGAITVPPHRTWL